MFPSTNGSVCVRRKENVESTVKMAGSCCVALGKGLSELSGNSYNGTVDTLKAFLDCSLD